jgi:hypothetical protein
MSNPRPGEGVMRRFTDRPPGTLWVPAFVLPAEGFSPAAREVRQPDRRAKALGSLDKALRAGDVSCKSMLVKIRALMYTRRHIIRPVQVHIVVGSVHYAY